VLLSGRKKLPDQTVDRPDRCDLLARRASGGALASSSYRGGIVGSVKPDRAFVRDTRQAFIAYAVYALVAAVLAVGAWKTHGAVSLVLALLAGFFALVTIWCVVFMGGVLALVHYLNGLPGRGDRPPRDDLD
jgi:hypothetical protein